MLDTKNQARAFGVVLDVQPCNGTTRVLLESSAVATLVPSHPDYHLFLREAELSMRACRPVAIALDSAGCIADLSRTHLVSVRSVSEDDEDPNRVRVALWELGALTYLSREHPEFERIRLTLAKAADSGRQVLLANQTWPVEGETEVWNAILDVRAAPEAGMNGTSN